MLSVLTHKCRRPIKLQTTRTHKAYTKPRKKNFCFLCRCYVHLMWLLRQWPIAHQMPTNNTIFKKKNKNRKEHRRSEEPYGSNEKKGKNRKSYWKRPPTRMHLNNIWMTEWHYNSTQKQCVCVRESLSQCCTRPSLGSLQWTQMEWIAATTHT